jgi:UDP-glucose 4-epimerase
MNMKKVLLVGGGGFLGAHLAAALHARGYGVVALGRRAEPAHALPENVDYLSGDYGDLATLRSALR